MPADNTRLEVRPLEGRFGAQILGVDLHHRLDGSTFRLIKANLLKHQVIAFREQRLDGSDHLALLSRFGRSARDDPGAHPAGWHTDGTPAVAPPQILALRAAGPTPPGGQTRFASTAGAYRDLPDSLRTLADRLWAAHDGHQRHNRAGSGDGDDAASIQHRAQVAHPVVRVHPESGDRGLLIGAFARRLLGHSASESHDLLQLLQMHVTRTENVINWNWQPGDVLLVDNRITQHHTHEDAAHPPDLVATSVDGDAPLGVNGQHSHPLTDPGDRIRTQADLPQQHLQASPRGRAMTTIRLDRRGTRR
jgi:taurine dioxygenase